MTAGFFWVFISLLIYGAIHSFFASLEIKAIAERWLGGFYQRFYRIFYNAVGFFTFFPVLWLIRFMPDETIYRLFFPWSLAGSALQLAALLGLIIGGWQTGLLSLAGLRQAFFPENESRSGKLVTNGFYRWVRHPIYSFGLLFIWCTPLMTWNYLGFNLGITIYIIIGALLEERKLIKEYGDSYREYRRRTPMLIPLLKRSPEN